MNLCNVKGFHCLMNIQLPTFYRAQMSSFTYLRMLITVSPYFFCAGGSQTLFVALEPPRTYWLQVAGFHPQCQIQQI